MPALDVSRYYLFQELSEYLRTAEEAAPHLMRLFSIGVSYEGRPLLLVEITNRATGEGHEKPAIWIDGNLQGCEVFGSSACLELIRQLTSNYGRDQNITELLDSCTFYIAPRLSPDGAEHCLTTGELVRSGTRPYPASNHHTGLRASDVNGDGRVLQMRVPDPQGEWKVSRRDPRLLVPRLADDRQGTFYRLYPEGASETSEMPVKVQPPRCGLNFDRNFPFQWQPNEKLEGAGPFPLSEPETRSVADFFRTHHNVAVVLSCGSMGQGVQLPVTQGPDENLYQLYARRIEELAGLNCFMDPEPQSGSFLEWTFKHQGLLAFRANPWSLGRAAGLEIPDEAAFLAFRSELESVTLLRWLDRELQGQGFGHWTAFEHPQLGPVEIGGWDLLHTWHNPPPGALLQAEVERFARLALILAGSLPRVTTRSCTEEVIGWSEFTPPEIQQGEFLPLRRVTVEFENRGYLPTWLCQRARDAGLAEPVQLRLLMEGNTELLIGQAAHGWGHLAGTSTALSLKGLDAAWFPGGDEAQRGRYEWLIRGPGRVHVEVRHSRSGVASITSQMGRSSSLSAEIPAAAGPVPITHHAPPPPPPPPPSMRPSFPVRSPGFGNLPSLPTGVPIQRPLVPGPVTPLVPPRVGQPLGAPAQRPAPSVGQPPPGLPTRPAVPAPNYGVPPSPAAQAPTQTRPLPQRPAAGVPLAPPALAPENPIPQVEPAATRGRVLGAPPTRPGAENFAKAAQDLVQGGRSQELPAGRNVTGALTSPSSEFEPFSPGFPMRATFPPAHPAPPRAADPPPSTDFDTYPPEAPAAESRIPTPLLLRKRDSKLK